MMYGQPVDLEGMPPGMAMHPGHMFPPMADPGWPEANFAPKGRPPGGPVRLEAHGPERVPLGAQHPPQEQMAAPPARQPRLDRLRRNPADVKAMLQENARRQYEQRFGMSPMGRGGPRQQSMAASGQQEELDALIARISQARMNQMADRRTARRAR
jgi:hypothetical protein